MTEVRCPLGEGNGARLDYLIPAIKLATGVVDVGQSQSRGQPRSAGSAGSSRLTARCPAVTLVIKVLLLLLPTE